MKEYDQKIRVARRSVGAHQGFAARACRPARSTSPGQPLVRRCRALSLPGRHPLARSASSFRGLPGGAPAPQSLEPERHLATGLRSPGAGGRQRVRDDRLDHRASPPAQCWGKRGAPQAIGRSRGGLSTKIHATVDALGNPTGFHLTPG